MKLQILNSIDNALANVWQSENFIQTLLNLNNQNVMGFVNNVLQNIPHIAKSHNYLSQPNNLVVNGIQLDINQVLEEHEICYSVKVITYINSIGNNHNIPPAYNINNFTLNNENLNNINTRLQAIRNVHYELDNAYIERSFFLEYDGFKIVIYFFIAQTQR
jgi:hypothetical protein